MKEDHCARSASTVNPTPSYAIMAVIILIYLFGDCFMDALAILIFPQIALFLPGLMR